MKRTRERRAHVHRRALAPQRCPGTDLQRRDRKFGGTVTQANALDLHRVGGLHLWDPAAASGGDAVRERQPGDETTERLEEQGEEDAPNAGGSLCRTDERVIGS